MYKKREGYLPIILAISVFALVAVGGYFLFGPGAPSPIPPTPAPAPQPGPITVKGEVTCLPKPGPGPHTLECAIGLRGDDGAHYGLINYQYYDTGVRVRVFGTFIPKEPSEKYDVVGNINVSSVEIISKPAPLPPPSGGRVILREGERNGPFLLQKVYTDYVTGLAFREYPVAVDNGTSITLYVDDSVSNGCTETLTLISVDVAAKTATFDKETDYNRPCPICLSEGTLIDTPEGQIAVENIKTGTKVWTTNLLGEKISTEILMVSKSLAPVGHEMQKIILEDGRTLEVSPLHPTADGRFAFTLKAGEASEGSKIISNERLAYSRKFTYDILPAGDAGTYWANGILIGSTLKAK